MLLVAVRVVVAVLPAAVSPTLAGSRNGTGGARSSAGLIPARAGPASFETGNSGRVSRFGLTGIFGDIPAAISAAGNFTSGSRVAGLVNAGLTDDSVRTSRGILRPVSGVGNGGAIGRGMAGFG